MHLYQPSPHMQWGQHLWPMSSVLDGPRSSFTRRDNRWGVLLLLDAQPQGQSMGMCCCCLTLGSEYHFCS